MGKGGIVFYFWGADATEKGSLGPNTVVNSNQKIILPLDLRQSDLDGGTRIEVSIFQQSFALVEKNHGVLYRCLSEQESK